MRTYLGALFFILVACTASGPTPINFGADPCAHCRMTITDKKFASELVSYTGKALKFDSPECLIGYYYQTSVESHTRITSIWVSNFNKPGELIDAKSASYLRSSELHSPMGLNVAAFVNNQEASAMLERYPGMILNFDSVVKLATGR
ncbi:MAG: nitrous oxide reductase accessory protein NosL [Ignavibacteria bacterium]|nr:nitrous oxide reductase accessory protein NosL [Ignavibacteria bacterium]